MNFQLWSGSDFGTEINRIFRYESVIYEAKWFFPPDATAKEIQVFVRENLKFIPAHDHAVPPPKLPQRPIGHRPTLINLCTDFLRFRDPPLLI